MFILPLLISIVTLPFTLLVLVFTKLPKPVVIIAVISALALLGLLGTVTCNFWQTTPTL